jgi:RHS repeat-associated protein
VWGDVVFDVTGPISSSQRQVDVQFVDVATGTVVDGGNYPQFCAGFCTTVGVFSDLLTGLVPGRSYQGRVRIRPTANEADWSPWFTTQAHPALFTPGIPGDMAGQCTCGQIQQYMGDPVNTATGAFVESVVDVQGTGPGVPLQVARMYSSLATTVSSFGKGWSWAYDSSLSVSASEIAVHAADGATIRFTKDGAGVWQPPAGVTNRLRVVGSGWEMRNPDGSTYRYDTAGLLTGIVDAAGVGVTLAYVAGKLATMTERGGRVATVTWDTDRIAKIALSDGRQVSYSYTGGLLTGVTDVRGKVTQYGYDGSARIATVTDPLGRVITKNTYDATTGRVATQTGPTGGATQFQWDADTGAAHTIDPSGAVWTDVYSAGVLTSSIDPAGGETSFTYDGHLNRIESVDPRFARTRMTYDARGNMLTRTAPAPLSYQESWVYDAEDNVTSATDGRGKTTTFTYDAANRPTSTTDPGGGKTVLTYTALGQLATQKTPLGNVTTQDYDTAGNVVSKTSPLGFVQRFGYDAAGRVVSSQDPRGSVAGATPEDYTTHYTYDAAGNVLTVTNPDDSVTRSSYDDVGKLTSATTENPAGAVLSKAGYKYDAAGRTTEESDAVRVTSTSTYDSRGNRTSSTDAVGAKTTYTYDALNRVATMTTPRGNDAGANPDAFTWSYGYDANGNQLSQTDGAGRKTSQSFDVLNRVATVTSPSGAVTTTTYDAIGNVLTSKDALNQVTTNVYDTVGRLQSTALPSLQPTTFTYDLDGHRLSAKSPSGGSVTKWTYDADGRQTSQIDPRGNVTGGTPADHTTKFGYDPAGNQITETDKLGKITTRTYDRSSNLVSERNPRGFSTTYAYDALQRLTSVTSPVAAATTSYTYDAVGNLIERKDPRAAITKYGYDPRGELTSIIDPLNRKQTFGYDSEGNATEIVKARGYASGDLPTYTIKQSYDLRGLRTGVTTASAATNATFGYNADGQLTSYGDVTGATTLTRDAIGQLKGVAQPQGSYTYTYTPYGAVASRIQPGGANTTYGFDTDGRPTSMGTDGQSTKFGYDADNHLTSVVYPSSSGYTQTRTYDRNGDVSAVVNQKSGATTPLSRYDYVRDVVHHPVVIKRTRGTTVYNETFSYDPANRLIKNCVGVTTCTSATQYIDYTYDDNGNRLTENRVGVTGPGTIKYTFDAANQMINRTTPDGTVTPVHYDADGQVQDGRQWDVLGRIAQEGITNFTYDAMGLRRTVQNSAGTKKLSWDINNPMPMLAVETRTDNSTFRFRNAPDGSPVYVQHAGKAYARSLQFPDAIGSVTDVLDENGGARWRYGYEPFGAKRTSEKLNTTAEDPQIGFTGAYLEPTTGNYHLRARDLNPWGTFLSPDPVAPALDDPYITQYAYANQQPTLYTDPTGQQIGLPSWLQEGLVGAYGGIIEAEIAIAPGGQQIDLVWSLTTGKSQAEWYYYYTDKYYGIDGTSTASQIGSFVGPLLIPGGGEAGVICRIGEAERFGFLIARRSPSLRGIAESEFGNLAHSNQGIKPYSVQRKITAGQNHEIEAHHLIEQRFARVMGGNTDSWPTVVLTQAEHKVFTDAWRKEIPYGEATQNATRAQVENAARKIYAKYPEILKALGLK